MCIEVLSMDSIYCSKILLFFHSLLKVSEQFEMGRNRDDDSDNRHAEDKRISSLLTRYVTGSKQRNATRIINWSIKNMPSGSQTIIVL